MAARVEGSLISTRSWSTDISEASQTSGSIVHSVSIISRDGSAISKVPRCCGHNYRIQYVFSKGAYLLLLWVFMIHVFLPISTSLHLLQLVLGYHHEVPFHNINGNVYRALFILYPLMGWLADAKIGRYKAIIYSIFSIFIASILMSIGYLIHIYNEGHYHSLKIIFITILGVSIIFNVAGFACFDANIIPFLTDQVQGASGEMLSALIHWHFWLSSLSEAINVIMSYTSSVLRSQNLVLTTLVIHSLLFSIVLITSAWYKDWLDSSPQITNPFKLIFKVLNYARKNKYPKNRSALTYWEEDYPSRLNLGKEKYGGPFLEEEVEDVKTTIRLLPVVFLSTGFGILTDSIQYIKHLQHPTLNSNWRRVAQALVEDYFFHNAIYMIVFIIAFAIFIYPCFYNYIPSLMKRIGFGLSLCTLSVLYYVILDPVAHTVTHHDVCLFTNTTASLTLDYRWSFPPVILAALGEMVIVPFAVEFIVAQSPGPMKGFMVGLWFAFYGFVQLICLNLYYPFTAISDTAQPSCTFYYYITKTIISVVFLGLFIYLAHRYTMRVRDCPINFHILAENHYNKYLSINSSDNDSDSSTSSIYENSP